MHRKLLVLNYKVGQYPGLLEVVPRILGGLEWGRLDEEHHRHSVESIPEVWLDVCSWQSHRYLMELYELILYSSSLSQ